MTQPPPVPPLLPPQSPPDNAALDDVVAAELTYIRHHRHPTRDPGDLRRTLVGLALSGGGIRSATTNLGVLQALSRMNILPMVDYMSTVSGGGYIGSCLSSLLSWNGKPPAGVRTTSEPYTFTSTEAPKFSTEWANFPFRPELQPDAPGGRLGREIIGHLRTHGNFLIARWGLARREAMRALGNILTGIVFSLSVFLLTVFTFSAGHLTVARWIAPVLDSVLVDSASRVASRVSHVRSPIAVDSTIVRESTADCAPGSPTCTVRTTTTLREPTVWESASYNVSVVWRVLHRAWNEWGRHGYSLFELPRALRPLWNALVRGALFATAMFILWLVLVRYVRSNPERFATPEPGEGVEDVYERRLLWTTVTLLLLLMVWVFVIDRRDPLDPGEFRREQLVALFVPFALMLGARFASLVLGVAVLPALPIWTRRARSIWGGFEAITIYGLWLMALFALLPFGMYALRDHSLGVGLSGFGSLILARLLTGRGAAGQKARVAIPAAILRPLLGFVVVVLLLCGVLFFGALVARFTSELQAGMLAFGIGLVLLLAIGVLVDYNRLSPHYFYRDRLAETYLRTELADREGALHVYRDAIEMPLTALHGQPASAQDEAWRNPAPYHLISAAINLAGSRDLTRKDRKSGYWLFSKLYCGSIHTGFRRTATYRKGGTKLARAVAISGAAASAAMGMNTFFAQAFATVIFNVRLGFWMENPRYAKSAMGQERMAFWPMYVAREILMDTTENARLVNLSDGGHTGDNVGIYPLLQRRCKVIIVCDAEQDPRITFGSFTEALRHAYVDLGIDVDIDLTMVRPDPATGISRNHSAIGRIRYPDRPDQESYLVYIKNSLTGDEPEPVLNYKTESPDFPHESTADQFFSDAQFESYRALGVHLAEHTFGQWAKDRIFPLVREYHGPAPATWAGVQS